MMYRVSQRTVYRNINTNLGFLTYDMARINNQVATGKKVNKPSDDPSGGALIMAMRTVLADVDQYRKDVAIADDWLKQSESILTNMKLMVDRANELCEQMSTDTYMPENMDVAANEIEKLKEGLIKDGNTKISDRYLFAGQKTDTQPFSNNIEILDPYADPGNSASYTGFIKPPQDRTYVPRPDQPEQTLNYMAEIVRTGGAGTYSLANVTIDQAGSDNALIFTATEEFLGQAGNDIQIQYTDTGSLVTTATIAPGPPHNITVDLAVDPNPPNNVVATAADVKRAIESNPEVTRYVTVDWGPATDYGSGLVADTGGFQILSGGVDFGQAQARVTIDPQGDNNTIIYEANPAVIPPTGLNGMTVSYNAVNVAGPPYLPLNVTTLAGPPPAVTVDVLYDTTLNEWVTTADEIINAINTDPAASALISGRIPPNGSGAGAVEMPSTAPGYTDTYTMSGAADDGALYRVSTDGGETWSAKLFRVSDLKNPPLMYNDKLGHAYLNTSFPGSGNDLFIVAQNTGVSFQDISIEFIDPGVAGPLGVAVNDHQIVVTLAHDGANLTSTANDVMNAINAHPVAGVMVHADLTDYREGGNGVVNHLAETKLSGADSNVTALGHATWTTTQKFAPPDENPNVQFTALSHGIVGNDIQIEYRRAAAAGTPTQVISVTDTMVTIELEVDNNLEVKATAQDIVSAVNRYHFNNPDDSLVVANLPDYPDGGGVFNVPALPESTVFQLAGGDDEISITDHGARIRFEGDGSSLTTGDKFIAPVDYYHGDDQDIFINANIGYRVKINVTGIEALGATGAADNILDTMSRLEFALRQHDTVKTADELDALNEVLKKMTTNMAGVGVRITRNQFTYNVLEATEVNSTERMSRVEDVDIADAVTELQTKQMAYQAALASTSLVTRLSLVDYIR